MKWSYLTRGRTAAFFMALLLSCGQVLPAFAESRGSGAEILINETFNSDPTGSPAEAVQCTSAKGRVVKTSEDNKALYVTSSSGNGSIRVSAGQTFGEYYVYALSLKAAGEPINLTIGAAGPGGKPVALLYIRNNVIYTYDGYEAGAVSTFKFTNVAVTAAKNTIFDVYVDGGKTVEAWPMPNGIQTGDAVLEMNCSSVYIDDWQVYEARRLYSCIPKAGMNPESRDWIGVDSDVGDYKYFDSNEMNTSGRTYENFRSYPKTGKITCGRYDYKNKNRDNAIVFEKTTADDSYFDVTLLKYTQMKSAVQYRYFLIEGDFTAIELSTAFGILIRDSSSGTNQSQTILKFQPGGTAVVANSKSAGGAFVEGVSSSFKLALNLDTKMADLYINERLVISDVPTSSAIDELNLVRATTGAASGRDTVRLENFKITGLVVPYTGGVETKTSIFPAEDEIRAYLADKTAFHGYGKQMYAHGQKSSIEDSVFENDELYVSPETLNKAFGLSLEETGDGLKSGELRIKADGSVSGAVGLKLENAPKTIGGRIYIPVREFAKRVLGQHVWYYKAGLILVSETEINLDALEQDYYVFRPYESGKTILTDIDHLDNFMAFARPEEVELAETFNRVTKNGAMHPRIIAKKEDFDTIRSRLGKNAEADLLVKGIREQADYFYNQPVTDYVFDDSMRQQNSCRREVRSFMFWGFMWQVTGEKKWAERAWENVEMLATFPDFNTSHVIDAGEYNLALAVAYDWFYDYWTDAQKKVISDILLNTCLKDLANGYYGRLTSSCSGNRGWMSYAFVQNFSTCINSGAVTAALAIAETDPKYCFDVIRQGMRGLEYTAIGFAPEGGWDEGPHYAEYVLQTYSAATLSIRNAFGTDYGFLKHQGVDGTMDYITQLYGPCGMNNYHDAESTSLHYDFVGYAAPFAKLFGREDIMALNKRFVQTEGTGAFSTNPDSVYTALFYDFDTDAGKADAIPLDGLTAGTESFSIRGSNDWTDGSLYLSGHFGNGKTSHSHNDTGTFVFDILGERWVKDLGWEAYNLTNEAGVASYMTYRRRPEGHNTLVVNNGEQYNQTETSFAPVTRFESNESGAVAVADMTGVYADTSSARTGYYVGDNRRSMTVRHEIELTKKSTVYYFMHTDADLHIDEQNQTAYLYQNGKSLIARYSVSGADDAQVSVAEAVPLPTSPNPTGQSPNFGTKKLAFRVEGSGKLAIEVKLAPMGESAQEAAMLNLPIDEWSLPQATPDVRAENLGMRLMNESGEISGAVAAYADDKVTYLPEVSVHTDSDDVIIEKREAKTPEEQTIITVTDPKTGYSNIGIVSYVSSPSKPVDMFDIIPIGSVSATSEPQPENAKENMLDGDYSTRWTTLSKGESATFDLGRTAEIDAVGIAFWYGASREYYFDLAVSEDGISFTDVFSGKSALLDEGLQTFEFTKCGARFIRITGYGNSAATAVNVNTNILEFRALKSKY